MSRRFAPALVVALVSALGAASVPVLTQERTVTVRVLAINDFHGTLETPSGSQGMLDGRPVGGLVALAGQIARLRRDAPNSVVVSAGDNIGASPLISALFHDEPTIEGLSAAGLEFSAVGNHELDDGWRELQRMQRGGCHPVDGCQAGTSFAGASFRFLAANIHLQPAAGARGRAGTSEPRDGDTLFPAFAVREFDGVKVGFIGLTLRSAPAIVKAGAIDGLAFEDEARAANRAVAALRRQGIKAIVVLIHQGAEADAPASGACQLSEEIDRFLRRLSPEVDLVVSGHTHNAYNCTVRHTLLTSTGAFGRRLTRIDLVINRRTGQVVDRQAENLPVTRDVDAPPAVAAIVDRYRALAVKEAQRPAGAITGPVTRRPNEVRESPLGDVIADAMLEAGRAPHPAGAVLALMNPGGIRTDLVRSVADGETAGTITVGDVFKVLPFGNQVLVKTMTGAALLRLLEQQFDNPETGQDAVLQVSNGFTYRYTRTRPPGQRIDRASMRLNGEPIVPGASYRIAMPDFLWQGGDRFSVAREESRALTPLGGDLEVLAAYLKAHSPVAAPVPGRIQRDDSR